MSSLADPRNLATLLLYSLLAYLGLAARPWRVLQEWSGHREVGADVPACIVCRTVRKLLQGHAAGCRHVHMGRHTACTPQPAADEALVELEPGWVTFASTCTTTIQLWPCLQEAPSPAERSARWRLAVLAGLLVGPFFPASNVLFYVGTFIGERLLYFPSGKPWYCFVLFSFLLVSSGHSLASSCCTFRQVRHG